MIVGDGPSKEESTKKRSFTDQRAKLLGDMLQEVGINVSDTGDVYATYLCKCPSIGKVKTTNARICADTYLIKEIVHFKPKMILALGKNAQLILLHNSAPLSKTHGKVFDAKFEWEGEEVETKVMPVDHPFAVLSSPSKYKAWAADIGRAKAVLYNEGEPFWTPEKNDRFDFQLIESVAQFKTVAKDLIQNHRGSYLAIDIEASGLDEDMPKEDFKVYTLQFGVVDLKKKCNNDDNPVYMLPIQSAHFACTQNPDWLSKLVPLLNNFLQYFKLVAHNGKYDAKGLRRIGVDQAYIYWDTMMLWSNVNGEAPMSLKEIAYQVSDLGGYENIMTEYFAEHGTYDAPPEILVPYGGLDIVVTRHLLYEMNQEIWR
jgi:uracil-DNA glycosylase family 4